ncbi:sigma-54 interaction domain-containing protein [Acidobacteriota bacterium]
MIIGASQSIRNVCDLIDKIKTRDVPVFIRGESGTGKELVARKIHESSLRRNGQFVAVNCGALPENLLESELFGYTRGAFTGAYRDKPGLIEEASGGTFFLDEIGDLYTHLQAKLLRFLQEREIRRVGDNRTRHVDVRLISATHKDIEAEVLQGRFREDLYYRLKILTIELPPLRKRKEDIFLFIDSFLKKYSKELGRKDMIFSPEAVEILVNYSWPGNVRELQNEIQRCLILSDGDGVISADCLSSKMNPAKDNVKALPDDFFLAKAEFEKRFVYQALTQFRFNRVKTAQKIGISRQGLFKLMKRHDIVVPSSPKE